MRGPGPVADVVRHLGLRLRVYLGGTHSNTIFDHTFTSPQSTTTLKFRNKSSRSRGNPKL